MDGGNLGRPRKGSCILLGHAVHFCEGGASFPPLTTPKGPRTQTIGFYGPNTINSIVFGP